MRPPTLLEQAAALLQAGELTDALAALNQQLEAHPTDDPARRLRAGVLRHLGGEAARRAALADLAQLADPTADDAIQQAQLLEALDDLPAALAVLAQAAARWPQHERLAERRIALLLRQGQAETALAVVRQMPQTWHWLQTEGDILAALGDDVTATARYGLALAQLDSQLTPAQKHSHGPMRARLLLARAAAYRRLGFDDQAEALYAQAETIIPNDPAVPFGRGLMAWQRGDHDSALRLCRAALSSASASLQAALLADLRADTRFAPLLHRLTERET